MSKLKYTPGPWTIYASRIEGTWIDPIGVRVDDGPPNWRANAALIAAAPELLAVCEELADRIGLDLASVNWTGANGGDWYERLKSAISKARGESV